MIGKQFSHYRIIEQIGAGGMGVVYRAHDEQLDRDVAIKVLPPQTLGDEIARTRFRQEALSLAKLNHPNVATVHEFNSQDGTDFLVTEYIPGATLDRELAGGALAADEVIGLGVQLAQGLAAAHERGIVHRDLKPSNLRLTPDGRLKILDFGLARLMPHASEQGMTATLTQSQEVTGTLPYMAPEQLRGEPSDARTDIWAAGAVLYEMATGKRPFNGDTNPLLINAILDQNPLPPRKLNRKIPPGLENVILKALNKAPTRRHQTARELGQDLNIMQAKASPLPQACSRLRGPDRINLLAQPKKYVVLAFLAIVLALLGGYLIFSGVKRVIVRITTDPAGAEVTVGAQKCRTPCDLPFRPGTYELRVEWDGYVPLTQRVTVTAGTKSLPTMKLIEMAVARPLPPPSAVQNEIARGKGKKLPEQEPKPEPAYLVVHAQPGTDILIDKKLRGTVPPEGLLLQKVRPGRHSIEGKLNGHELWSGTVIAVSGKQVPVRTEGPTFGLWTLRSEAMQCIDRFKLAYESGSVDELIKVWPSLANDTRRREAFKASFRAAQPLRLEDQCDDPSVSGETARLQCSETLTYSVGGKTLNSQAQAVEFVCKKTSTGWVVDSRTAK